MNLHVKKSRSSPLAGYPDYDKALLMEINHPHPLPSVVYSNFFAGEHFSPPANLFKHFQANQMQASLSDQAKLPKRPLIVYRVEADERQAGGEGEES